MLVLGECDIVTILKTGAGLIERRYKAVFIDTGNYAVDGILACGVKASKVVLVFATSMMLIVELLVGDAIARCVLPGLKAAVDLVNNRALLFRVTRLLFGLLELWRDMCSVPEATSKMEYLSLLVIQTSQDPSGENVR